MNSLNHHHGEVKRAVEIGKGKLQEPLDVAAWTGFLEEVLMPVWQLADNDFKDAIRRINSEKARRKKLLEGAEEVANEDSDHEPPERDEDED